MISSMIYAYWEVGHHIVEQQQAGQERAEYGASLVKELAKQFSRALGKNFDARELRRIRQFYLYFPNRDALRPEVSWSHYRLLLRIEDKWEREFYVEKLIRERWSTRKLEENIKNLYYQQNV